MIKKHNGIINDCDQNILQEKMNMGDLDLFDFSIWKNGIEGFIATSYFFAPTFVQIGDYIFLYDLIRYNDCEDANFISDLQNRFVTKEAIERYVNCVCLGDMFINDQSSSLDDTAVLYKFIDCVTHFWKIRLSQVFPNKTFVFERGYNLNGDLGLCFTFYEETTNINGVKT